MINNCEQNMGREKPFHVLHRNLFVQYNLFAKKYFEVRLSGIKRNGKVELYEIFKKHVFRAYCRILLYFE